MRHRVSRTGLAAFLVGLVGAAAPGVSAAGATPGATGVVSSRPTARHAPIPFACLTPTIFLSQKLPTQLLGGTLGAGKITFSPIGSKSAWSYNALAFDTKNSYLYGVSVAGSSRYPTGHLLQIDSSGAVTDLGAISGDKYITKFGATNGAFDSAGNLWVMRNAFPAVDEVSLTSRPPKVLKSLKLSPSSPGWLDSDFADASGYLWGMAAETSGPKTSVVIQRLNLVNGTIGTYAAPSSIPASSSYGASWTFGNGDLGFQSNQTGQIFELAVANASSTPKFTFLSSYAGPASPSNNDGAACAPKPVDLAIGLKASPPAVLPGGKITWTATVTNNGPGISSGYLIADQLPTGITNAASPSPGCVVSPPGVNGRYTVSCSEGELGLHKSQGVTITGDVTLSRPPTSVTNVVTVVGNERDPGSSNNSASSLTSVTKAAPTISSTTASGNGAAGGQFTDSAVLSGGATPSGTITFKVYGPGDSNCSKSPAGAVTTLNFSGDGTYSSPPVTVSRAGTYEWVAIYSGDAFNAAFTTQCGNEPFTVGKASPTISSSPSPASDLAGATFSDKATLAGGVNPTGSITFKLYGAGDTTCAQSPIDTATVSVTSGDGDYNSPSFTLAAAGTYEWTASYSGDGNNDSVSASCGSEAVTVSQAGPSLITSPAPASGAAGGMFSDGATLSGGSNPTGSITFNLYSAGDTTCSLEPLESATVSVSNGNGTYDSPSYPLSVVGTYDWTASYSGDANNQSFSSACGSEVVTVSKASPTLSSSTSPASGSEGSTLFSDTATLSGSSGQTDGESVSFTLYGPFASAQSITSSSCTDAKFVDTESATLGAGQATASGQTVDAIGVYQFVASYPGDGSNNFATTTCGESDEQFLASKASPSITSTTPSESALAGSSFTDSATLSGGLSPSGTITFNVYGPNDPSCSNVPAGTGTASVSGDNSYTSSSVALTTPGTYSWRATYSGDGNNNSFGPTSCNVETVTVTAPPPFGTGFVADTGAFDVFNPSANTYTAKVNSSTIAGIGPTTPRQLVALTPNGSFAYEIGPGSSTVYVISTSSDKVATTVSLPNGAESIAMAPNGQTVWVGTTGPMVAISTASNTAIAEIPYSNGNPTYWTGFLGSDSTKVYVLGFSSIAGGWALGVINASSGNPAQWTVTSALDLENLGGANTGTTVCTASPGALVFDPNTPTTAYTSCQGSGNVGYVLALDLSGQSPALLGWQPVGSTPLDPVVTSDSATLFVANYSSATVSALNAGTLQSATGQATGEHTIQLGAGTNPDALAVVGSKVYVAEYTPGTVTPYNVSNDQAGTAIIVGTNPQRMAVDGSTIYVADYGSSALSAIDTSTEAVTATIALSGSPEEIVFANPGATTTSTHVGVPNPSPATAGSPVTYTATITPAPDGGTVVFADSTGVLSGCGSQSITAGHATCTITYQSAGQDMVTATYSGDSNFDGSTSNTVTETINPSATPPPFGTGFVADTGAFDVFNPSANTYTAKVNSSTIAGIGPTTPRQLVALTPNGSFAYEIGPGSSTVYVISTSSDKVATTVSLPNGAESIAMAPNGQTVWVGTTGPMVAISTASNTAIAEIPYSNGNPTYWTGFLGSDSTKVYVLGFSSIAGGWALGVINASSGNPAQWTVTSALDLENLGGANTGTTVCTASPGALVFDPNTPTTAYTSCQGSGNVGYVLALDLSGQSPALLGWQPVGSTPLDPVVTSDSATLFVANYSSATVSALNAGTLQSATGQATGEHTIPTGAASSPDALTIVGSTLYVADYGYSTVTPYTIAGGTATAASSGPIIVGTNPQRMAVDGSTIYVADYGSSALSAIDTSTEAVTATIALSGSPEEIVFANPGATTTSTHVGVPNPSPATAGSPVTYTATITPAPDGGTVVFADSTGVLSGCGSQSITAGHATCTITYQSAGQDMVTATYSGDSNFDGSTSNTVTETINPSATPPPFGTGFVADTGAFDVFNPSANTYTAKVNSSTIAGIGPTTPRQLVALTPNGSFAYEIGPGSSTVYVISTSSDKVATTVSLPNGAESIAMAPNGQTVWVGTTGPMVAISTASNTAIAEIPYSNGNPTYWTGFLGSDSTKVYVLGFSSIAGGWALGVINASSGNPAQWTVTSALDLENLGGANTGTTVCTASPGALVFDPNTPTTAYTSCQGSGNVGYVLALDLSGQSPALLGWQPVGSTPLDPVVTSDSATLFVANYSSATVSALNAGTLQSATGQATGEHTIPTGAASSPDALTIVGSTLYVADYGYSTVTPYTIAGGTATAASSGPIIVGTNPQRMAVDGSTIYVADYGSSALSAIDTSTEAVTATIALSGSPEEIVFANPGATTTSTHVGVPNPSPATAGSPVTYTATITPAPDGGTVVFADSTGVLSGCGSQSITAGHATCTITYQSAGQDMVTATYSGDSNFDGSTSNTVTETINPSATPPPFGTGFVADTGAFDVFNPSANTYTAKVNSSTIAGIGPTTPRQLVALTPNGSFAYEIGPGSSTVYVISTSSDKVATTVSLPNGAESIAMAPNGQTVWVGTTGPMVAISTASNTAIAEIPYSNGNPTYWTGFLGSDSTKVYVLGFSSIAGGWALGVINASSGNPAQWTVTSALDLENLGGANTGTTVCTASPGALVFDPNTPTTAYTSCQGSGNVGYVLALDLSGQSPALLGWQPVGSTPLDPVVTSDSATLFVANYSSATVSALNAGTLQSATGQATGEHTIPTGAASSPDALTIVGSTLYVADYGYSTVTPYTIAGGTATAASSGPIIVGTNPQRMAVDGSTIYVADYGSSALSAIDTSTEAVTATIALSGSPEEIVFANPGATTTSTHVGVPNPSPATAGSPVTYTATITPAPDGGTVVFADSTGVLSGCGSQSITAGHATCTITYQSAGQDMVTATYSGDSNFDGSTSNTVTETINPSATPPPFGTGFVADTGAFDVFNPSANTYTAKVNSSTIAGIGPTTPRQLVALTPNGSFAYEIGPGSSTVYVISTSSDKVATTVSLPNGAESIAMAPNGQTVWVGTTGPMVAISTASNTAIAEIPYSNGNPTYWTGFLGSDSTKVYVLGFSSIAGGWALGVINASSGNPAQWTVTSALDLENLGGANTGTTVCTASPGALVFDPNTPTTAYTSCQGSGNVGYVLALDLSGQSPALLGWQPVGSTPLDPVVTSDSATLFVANYSSATVSALNAGTLQSATGQATGEHTIPTGAASSPDALTIVGSTLYVADYGYSTVTPYTIAGGTATAASSGPIIVGTNPQRMAVDGSTIYVADYGSSALSAIDTSTEAVTATIALSGSPEEIVFANP